MAARRGLFKYFHERQWAEAFLDGGLRFSSLSYFADLEEQGTRGDANEGTAAFDPDGGLLIQTRGSRFTMSSYAQVSRAARDEIFVFCSSRAFSARLWDAFQAKVCIEIQDVPAFCSRVTAALPAGACFSGVPGRERLLWRVEYFKAADAPDTRWARPDRIAYSKQREFEWQQESRLIFSTTGALGFQRVALTLEPREAASAAPPIAVDPFRDVAATCLRDICRVHAARPFSAVERVPGTAK